VAVRMEEGEGQRGGGLARRSTAGTGIEYCWRWLDFLRQPSLRFSARFRFLASAATVFRLCFLGPFFEFFSTRFCCQLKISIV
jgi:hypothetical protein